MNKDVYYSDRLFFGIKKNHRSATLDKNLRVLGGDTETVSGKIHTLQVSNGKDTRLLYTTPQKAFWDFWDTVREMGREHGTNLCYFHNLKFDSTVLFQPWQKVIYEQFNDIRFTAIRKNERVKVQILYGKVNAARLYTSSFRIRLLDSFHFTTTSLARSLKMFKIPYEKKPMPKGLGKKALTGKTFETYAKQDALAVRELGVVIQSFHKQYRVSPCVSLPQFAFKVFRHKFFEKDTVIHFPPREVAKAAEWSYHGGKNGFYVDRPQVVDRVYEVDINSSYPNAMAKLPALTGGVYNTYTGFHTPQDFPGASIHEIEGWSDPSRKYPLLFDQDFRRLNGDFKHAVVTGYELEKMTPAAGYKFKVKRSHHWSPDDTSTLNPFKKFVEEFYHLKEITPRSEPGYNFYKLTMNALYGKFIASVEKRDVSVAATKEEIPYGVDMVWDKVLEKFTRNTRRWEASPSYNPFIGSLITGFARARLYEMEIKYQALHSATDSVKTLLKPENIPGLGGQKIETYGTCFFLRNKFYLHYAESFEFCGHDKDPDARFKRKSDFYKDQHLCKMAFHGWRAKSETGLRFLLDHRDEFMKTHHLEYSYEHSVGLREGLKRGETPANFVGREEIACLCVHSDVNCRDFRLKCHCFKKKD